MGKREKKIEVITRCLPNCYSCDTCYTYGHIPKEKFYNACRSYAGNVNYEDCIGLIDETVWGSGKKGMIFAVDGFYTSSQNRLLKYEDGYSFNSLASPYNLTAINEMLHTLYEIETSPSGWEIAGGLAGAFLGLLQSVADELPNDDQSTDENSEPDSSDFDDDTKEFLEHFLNNIKQAQVCINEILETLDEDSTVNITDELKELSSILSEEVGEEYDEITFLEMFDEMVDVFIEEYQDLDIPIERINLADSTVGFFQTLDLLAKELSQDHDVDSFIWSLKKELKELNILLKKAKKMTLAIKDLADEENME